MAGFMPMTEKTLPDIIIAYPFEPRGNSQYRIFPAFRLERHPLIFCMVKGFAQTIGNTT